jgi:hypothetical protein
MNKFSTRSPSRRRRLPALLASMSVVVLIAASCGGGDDSSETESGPPTVEITSPADDAQVGESFDVDLAVNFDIGEPDTGRDHVHLYYDGNTAEGEYDLVYEPRFTVDRLDPGEHTIEAVIANADHSLTDAREEITVTVGEDGTGGSGTGGTGGGSDAPTTTEADDGGAGPYGY